MGGGVSPGTRFIINMFYSIYFQNICFTKYVFDIFSPCFRSIYKIHFDAPETRREDVKDIFGKTNVLEIDTIKHVDNDKDATNHITVLVLNLVPGKCGGGGAGEGVFLKHEFDFSCCRIERPANLYSTYGRTVGEDFKPGLIEVLRACYLDKFVKKIRKGEQVKRAVWFFKREEDIADVNDFLCDVLPDESADPSTCPWVVNFSGVGPATARSIRERGDEISLYLTTSVMLMGIDLTSIQVIGMVRPFSMIHSLVGTGMWQRGEEDGGSWETESGVLSSLQQVGLPLLFTLVQNARFDPDCRSDISENVEVSQAVRNFCLTDRCLKKTLMEYFGCEGSAGGSWCCSNCDQFVQ